jgi:hypothetical protein
MECGDLQALKAFEAFVLVSSDLTIDGGALKLWVEAYARVYQGCVATLLSVQLLSLTPELHFLPSDCLEEE